MKTESGVVVGKRGVIGEGEKLIKKRRCRKSNLLPLPKPERPISSVPKLFDACKEVFKGPGTVPPRQDVQRLQLILDNMKPEDVGLSKDVLFFQGRNVTRENPRITYTTIHKCKNFSLCIFFLPPTAVIPLHNHPGMTVFSKLLLGKMHIKAYDWVHPDQTENPVTSSRLRLARLEMDSVLAAPCNTSVLYPSAGGNIHAFTAVTPCAVLDVLGPPYSVEDNRDCSYYRDFAYSVFPDGAAEVREGQEGSFGWLEEIEMPKDLKLDVVEYMGPSVH